MDLNVHDTIKSPFFIGLQALIQRKRQVRIPHMSRIIGANTLERCPFAKSVIISRNEDSAFTVMLKACTIFRS